MYSKNNAPKNSRIFTKTQINNYYNVRHYEKKHLLYRNYVTLHISCKNSYDAIAASLLLNIPSRPSTKFTSRYQYVPTPSCSGNIKISWLAPIRQKRSAALLLNNRSPIIINEPTIYQCCFSYGYSYTYNCVMYNFSTSVSIVSGGVRLSIKSKTRIPGKLFKWLHYNGKLIETTYTRRTQCTCEWNCVILKWQ